MLMSLQVSIKRSPYLKGVLKVDYHKELEELKSLNHSGYKEGIFLRLLLDKFYELILKFKTFSDDLVTKVISHNLIKDLTF